MTTSVNQPEGKCPNCGRCPHCGHVPSIPYVQPYIYPQPYPQPYYPYWWYGTYTVTNGHT